MNSGNYNHTTDQDLLEQFYQSGDNELLGILLQRYTMLLLGVCMKYLKNEEAAKDSVQQVFLKAITELHKYKVKYFKSWIYMVAKNHCLMILRDKQGKIPLELNERMSIAAEEKDKKEFLQHDLTLDVMNAALKELNGEQQQCVTLFYINKKSYQEIAEQTGYTLMQVKSHIQNGKRNLKIGIENKLNELK